MQQFFVEELKAPWLDKKQRQQCLKVLRMRKGDRVRLVDSKGNGVIAEFTQDDLETMEIVESITWPEKKRKLRIIASMIRNERLEWMIQKACECGVDEIVLYSAQHGVVRDFGSREDRKLERLNLIAKEACEQSYRNIQVPVIKPIEINEIKSYMSDLNVFADIGEAPHFVECVNQDTTTITAFVGPEGGISTSERQQLFEMGFIEVSLGDNVLRAETASIYLCNMVSVCEVIR